jgi:predicted nucleotidyltransferase
MRLTEDQITSIRQAATEIFRARAQVWLFGSRVDDQKRDGDIDLLIRPDPTATDDLLRRKIRFLRAAGTPLGRAPHRCDHRTQRRPSLL